MAIICHCEAVRDRTIVDEIRRGARTVDDIAAACGAGSQCQGCVQSIVELLDRHADGVTPVRVGGVVGATA